MSWTWDSYRQAILEQCARDGLTAAETARRIGPDVSREAVMGRAWRTGVSFGSDLTGKLMRTCKESWDRRHAQRMGEGA